MSKKEQAFELYSQGKRPSDPDVKALGLGKRTTYNYFQQFKKNGAGLKPSLTQSQPLSTTKEQPLHTFILGDDRIPLFRIDIDDAYDQYRDVKSMGAEGDFSSFIRVACRFMRSIYQTGTGGNHGRTNGQEGLRGRCVEEAEPNGATPI
ncbi:MAG TPA: hypothetical protein VMW64_00835 [Dehalococcoidia bacterium]|nr:hypothetical protein [Dehalococcoidia bacterium]